MRANLFALLLIALIPASVFAEDCEPQRGGFLYLAEGQKIDSEHYAISIERQCDDELSIELQLFVGRHPNGMPINETLDTVKLFAAEKDFVFACRDDHGETGVIALGLHGSNPSRPFIVRAWNINRETNQLDEIFEGPAVCKRLVLGCC